MTLTCKDCSCYKYVGWDRRMNCDYTCTAGADMEDGDAAAYCESFENPSMSMAQIWREAAATRLEFEGRDSLDNRNRSLMDFVGDEDLEDEED